MTYRVRNIFIAVGLAVVAALLTTFYVANYKRHVRQAETTVTVYVATKDAALPTRNSATPQPTTHPASAAWTTTGSMTEGRSQPSATLLKDGKVLVAGGSPGAASTTAELYDPATGTWTATGNLNVGRSQHTATLLSDGRVLVAGGGGGNLTSAELYDPARGTWTATGSLNVGRYGHTATLLSTGVPSGSHPTMPISTESPDATGWPSTAAFAPPRRAGSSTGSSAPPHG